MRRPLSLVLSLPLLVLASCGGDANAADDPAAAAMKALASNDYDAAVANFDAALKGMDTSGPEYKDLSVARLEALAHIDVEKTKQSVAGLADATPADYGRVCQALLAAGDAKACVELMDAGVKAFPGNADMVALQDKITKAAASSEEGAAALKGLGYLGGD